MGHHINKDGQFQSDKYAVPADKIVLSFHDRLARFPLAYLAAWYKEVDPEFAEDIATRLNSVIAAERLARAENAEGVCPKCLGVGMVDEEREGRRHPVRCDECEGSGDPTEEEEGEDSEPESKEES